jgi:hypothetical protein
MMIRSLTRTERDWAFAALGAIYPSRASATLPVGICDLALADYLRDLFASIPLMAALGLRAAIWVVALAPPFVMRRMVTVVGLADDERRALLERLLGSPSYAVRQLVMALKAVGGLFFGGAASVKEAIFGGARTSPRGRGAEPVPVSTLLVRRRAEGGYVVVPR